MEHRLATADAESAKRPSDHTDFHMFVSTAQSKRTIKTQALKKESTSAAEMELSFQTTVSSILVSRGQGTHESNTAHKLNHP